MQQNNEIFMEMVIRLSCESKKKKQSLQKNNKEMLREMIEMVVKNYKHL